MSAAHPVQAVLESTALRRQRRCLPTAPIHIHLCRLHPGKKYLVTTEGQADTLSFLPSRLMTSLPSQISSARSFVIFVNNAYPRGVTLYPPI